MMDIRSTKLGKNPRSVCFMITSKWSVRCHLDLATMDNVYADDGGIAHARKNDMGFSSENIAET